ncbi:uncharacterized protein METZ01_LOCUS351780 [marine metagenome]|uniref:Uncharacterized protein n=1 Tax=marine metagenome TaxID=408172 RepID=A0A382RMQ3_9ZZZZ
MREVALRGRWIATSLSLLAMTRRKLETKNRGPGVNLLP